MAGLTALNEDTPVSAEDSTTLEEQPGVRVGSGKSAVIANESVLEQMQKLYEQRQAQQQGLGGFVETLKDATAWTAGGIHGPTEALSKRAEDKQKRAAELFDMQNKIAAQRSAIANRNAFFGTAPTAGGAAPTQTPGAAPADGGVAPTAQAPGVAQANQQSGGLLGLVADPALRQSIGATYLQDPGKAMTVLNGYLSKRAEEPQVRKEVNYLISLGMDPQKALTVALTKVAGSGAFVPHDLRSAQGTTQTTPLQSAGTFAGAPTAAPSAPAAAPRVAAPAAAPSAAPVTTSAAPAAPVTPAAPRAAAPAASVAATDTGFAPGSQEDLKIKEERELAKLESIKAEQKKTGEDIAMQRASTVEAGSSAQDRLASIDYLGGLLDTSPKAFGVLQRPGVVAATMSLVQDGINAGTLGTFGFKDLDAAVRKAGGTQQEIDAAQKAAREFALMQLSAAKIYLKGQGAVSDAERGLIRELAGSTKNSPAALRDFLEWGKIRANFDYKNGQAYSQFNDKNPNVSYERYKQTPEYKALKTEYENNIRVFGKTTQAKPAESPGKSLLNKYPPSSRN